MSDHAALIARLRKLRERAQRDVGPEAALARRKLRELMNAHGISEVDLRWPSGRPTAAPAPRKPSPASKTRPARPRPGGDPVEVRVQIGGIRISFDL